MIPKTELLELAGASGLLPTTIEKDHALGWILFAIAQHPTLSAWRFKGGTCLKKCYFDTYRFSEDLDFTLPAPSTAEAILEGLREVARWVSDNAGLDVPFEDVELEPSVNKLGQETFLAKLTFRGPLRQPRHSRQRIRFDLTHHELLGRQPVTRQVFHPYSDLPEPAPSVQCYALEEILAEKTRALVQRNGRARDVYDVVNIGRNFRALVEVNATRELTARKFAFKEMPEPAPEWIRAAIDVGVLATDWSQALKHQVRTLPPVEAFVADLDEILRWILVPQHTITTPASLALRPEEESVPIEGFMPGPGRERVRASARSASAQALDGIRFAARNRLLAQVRYHGVDRLVEPYSLRRQSTGNLLLYVFELRRGGRTVGAIKAYNVPDLEGVLVTEQAFRPRHLIEL